MSKINHSPASHFIPYTSESSGGQDVSKYCPLVAPEDAASTNCSPSPENTSSSEGLCCRFTGGGMLLPTSPDQTPAQPLNWEEEVERKGEGEKERNINDERESWIGDLLHAPHCGPRPQLGMCPDQELSHDLLVHRSTLNY
ncbi:hypothetical protein MDA_GLEAN10012048 [Myotis davidii]|uniref:Uncharacterized protein n=1 Tax=Myotis davidii TaxID=225400 RepID=L5M551_MYODS|nr:hypothetical protein MDA_GLEAN10012048 [Myotis davidii]